MNMLMFWCGRSSGRSHRGRGHKGRGHTTVRHLLVLTGFTEGNWTGYTGIVRMMGLVIVEFY